jgi:WD40 repeat protein
VIDYTNAPNIGWTNSSAIRAARFDLSDERLVTTGEDHRVVVWDWKTRLPLHILKGHQSWVYSACFGHRHTNWVVSCSFDRTACLWDLQNDKKPILRVEHEGDGIQDVQFSPDDRLFLTGGMDSTVRLWDSETGRMVPPILRHHDRVKQAQWSPDAKRIVSLTSEVTRVWHLDPRKPILEPITSDFSHDGQLELTNEGNTVQLRSPANGRDVIAQRWLGTNISALSFAGDRSDRFLALSCALSSASAAGSQIQLLDFGQKTTVGRPLMYDPSWANLVCSPDGSSFAFFQAPGKDIVTFNTNDVVVWQPERGSTIRRITFPDEIVECVAFDRTGRRLVIGSVLKPTERGVLRLVDLQANEKSAVLLTNWFRFGNVTFSADGQWLAAAGWDRTLYPGDAMIWPVAEPGQQFGKPFPLPHLDGVLFVAFSDSGRMIATASEDHTAKVWCRTNGTWQASPRLLRCEGEIHACALSHSGRWLATACRTPQSQLTLGWASDIQIWDITTGRPVSLPISFPEKVTRMGFVTRDSRLFVERWIPPAMPQRWLIDLGVDKGSATEFLLRAQLLCGERSFLSDGTKYLSQVTKENLSVDEALLRATRAGEREKLSTEECRELWRRLTP